jgi:hypothetical protein
VVSVGIVFVVTICRPEVTSIGIDLFLPDRYFVLYSTDNLFVRGVSLFAVRRSRDDQHRIISAFDTPNAVDSVRKSQSPFYTGHMQNFTHHAPRQLLVRLVLKIKYLFVTAQFSNPATKADYAAGIFGHCGEKLLITGQCVVHQKIH